jgi:DNA processing protein
MLYAKGNLELLNRALFRRGWQSQCELSRASRTHNLLVERSSDAGLTIVSGLAQGIDAAAHRGGLDGAASSIAFVGYRPRHRISGTHRDLAHELAARGA